MSHLVRLFASSKISCRYPRATAWSMYRSPPLRHRARSLRREVAHHHYFADLNGFPLPPRPGVAFGLDCRVVRRARGSTRLISRVRLIRRSASSNLVEDGSSLHQHVRPWTPDRGSIQVWLNLTPNVVGDGEQPPVGENVVRGLRSSPKFADACAEAGSPGRTVRAEGGRLDSAEEAGTTDGRRPWTCGRCVRGWSIRRRVWWTSCGSWPGRASR
jgi:hypothetical protein